MGTARTVALPTRESAELEALMRALLAEIRGLRADRVRDRTEDEALILAIAAAVEGHLFSAAELVAHATVDTELRRVLRGVTSPKKIGRRLARLAGRPIEGFRLVRVDRDESGCIWQLQIQERSSAAGARGV